MTTLFNAKSSDDVRECLERGDNINLSQNGKTPFLYHCLHNNIAPAIALISYGCDVINKNNNWNGLLIVCYKGHYELLRELLKYESIRDLINVSTLVGTPLTLTCMRGHTDIYDILLKYGADPEVPDIKGNTPLIHSCFLNRNYMIDSLLHIGVNANYQDPKGRTALFHCNSIDILDRLYSYGIDLNIRDMQGCTALIYFIEYGKSFELIKALVDYGADVNLRNRKNRTALTVATKTNRNDIVDLFSKYD